jgi:hypothetical protein
LHPSFLIANAHLNKSHIQTIVTLIHRQSFLQPSMSPRSLPHVFSSVSSI